MSTRQTHLPPRPRCPIQKKTISGSIAPTPPVNELSHDNSSSVSSVLEDEPVWLGELLSDCESKSIGQPLRRSASDSVTLLDGLADSLRSMCIAKDVENSVGNETCEQWDPSCTYGPNSPRRKCSSDFSNHSMVSALSEFVHLHHAAPVHTDVCSFAENSSNLNGNINESVRDFNTNENAAKRHNGQRSRVRKLQYIAELERKVNVLQVIPLGDLGYHMITNPYWTGDPHPILVRFLDNLCTNLYLSEIWNDLT